MKLNEIMERAGVPALLQMAARTKLRSKWPETLNAEFGLMVDRPGQRIILAVDDAKAFELLAGEIEHVTLDHPNRPAGTGGGNAPLGYARMER